MSFHFFPGWLQKVTFWLYIALTALVLMNLVFWGLFKIRDNYFPPPHEKQERDAWPHVYPGMSPSEVKALLTESYSRPFIYVPFLQHKERPYRGTYYTVEENWLRKTIGSGPWPPTKENFNVFLIGGSTTFGFGVPDDQTLPSHLQALFSEQDLKRPVRVYNLGQGNYYSTQERLLFEDLLISGIVPDMAIFIDGLNDFYSYESPKWTRYLSDVLERGTTAVLSRSLYQTSLSRAYRFVKRRFIKGEEKTGVANQQDLVIAKVIRRYLANKKWIEMVCAQYSIQPIFVWQPIPVFKHDPQYHISEGLELRFTPYAKEGYRYLEAILAEEDLGNNFLWCADMQENLRMPLYMDNYHYSGAMNQRLAQLIHDLLWERALLPMSDRLEKKSDTPLGH